MFGRLQHIALPVGIGPNKVVDAQMQQVEVERLGDIFVCTRGKSLYLMLR